MNLDARIQTPEPSNLAGKKRNQPGHERGKPAQAHTRTEQDTPEQMGSTHQHTRAHQGRTEAHPHQVAAPSSTSAE